MYEWWLRAAAWKNQVILHNILIIVKINYSNSGIKRFDDRNYHTVAGQRRTNPSTMVPDWTLMPECRCRTEAADYWKNCRCRTNFSPAFRHSFSTTCSLDAHWVSLFTSTNNSFFKCRNVGLFGIQSCSSVPEWTKIPMLEPVRYWNKGTQSGTGLLRNWTEIQDAGMPMPSYGNYGILQH